MINSVKGICCGKFIRWNRYSQRSWNRYSQRSWAVISSSLPASILLSHPPHPLPLPPLTVHSSLWYLMSNLTTWEVFAAMLTSSRLCRAGSATNKLGAITIEILVKSILLWSLKWDTRSKNCSSRCRRKTMAGNLHYCVFTPPPASFSSFSLPLRLPNPFLSLPPSLLPLPFSPSLPSPSALLSLPPSPLLPFLSALLP